ncbi:MAG: glycosyl hydrolase, partial [Akkermansiaceae bacterium]
VALLPNATKATLARFAECAHHHVIDTRFSSKPVNGQLTTEYRFEVEAMEGSGKGTLFALYPHQWKYSQVALTGESYRSVRGEMKLAMGDGFKTSVPIQGLLPMLPAEGISDKKQVTNYLKKEAAKLEMPFADTYWDGKFLGKLATLSGVAEVAGEKGLQKLFIDEIRRRLENWFLASKGEQSPLFYYDQSWGTLIGSKPSYGSDGQINDHHFHYGYFIRAAAEVARLDPTWAEKWGGMIELLIRDIASRNREDRLFPHLRCFDVYAGHSWASGHAKFGDGNNQESSSESMNAWYGLMLWGEITGNTKLRDTGVFLYNTERTAVEEYWFDVSNTNFPKDFPEVALGMIWGGKGSFSTWFSADIDCIHGINWLPFTPASIYMGRYPDYVKKNHDRIVEKRKKGNDYNNGWGDLVVMFNSLQDSRMGVDYLSSHPDCSLEGGNTHAFMSHWVHTLDRLGENDRSVTSSHPWVNVYVKNGKKTYAAYQFGSTPKDIKFSDGFVMIAKPGMTVKALGE